MGGAVQRDARAHLLGEHAARSPQTLRMITGNDGPDEDRSDTARS
ncbi:hypothetical protein ACGFR8_02940 [Streptomyces brevispora]